MVRLGAVALSMKLSGKIITLNLAAVMLISVSTFGVAYLKVSSGLNQLANEALAAAAATVQSEVKDLERKTQEVAVMLAGREDIIQALAQTNQAQIQDLSQKCLKQFGLGVITVANRSGTVVGRGHSSRVGDSVLAQANVKKALSGETVTLLEEGTEVKFSLRTGCPVKQGAEIIGTVTVGADLSKDHAFVDFIKNKHGVECTIFQKDRRESTTLLHDGQRLVGTRMDNPTVIETVLHQGKPFTSVNQIAGQAYDTYYWPIYGENHQMVGMFFIGKDRKYLEDARSQMLLALSGVMVVIGGLSLIAAFGLGRSIGRHTHSLRTPDP